MTKLEEIKSELAKLEDAKTRLEALKLEQKGLVDDLREQKKRLYEIKKTFELNVVPFVENFLKLDLIQDSMKKLVVTLGGGNGVEIIPIEKFFGCVGTLDTQNRNLALADEISPAVLGFQVFKLLRERKINGK